MADEDSIREIIRELAGLSAKMDALSTTVASALNAHGRLEERVTKLENSKAWIMGAAFAAGIIGSQGLPLLKMIAGAH